MIDFRTHIILVQPNQITDLPTDVRIHTICNWIQRKNFKKNFATNFRVMHYIPSSRKDNSNTIPMQCPSRFIDGLNPLWLWRLAAPCKSVRKALVTPWGHVGVRSCVNLPNALSPQWIWACDGRCHDASHCIMLRTSFHG